MNSSPAMLSAIGLVAVRHRHQQRRQAELAADPLDWIAANFSGYLWPPYAPYHTEYWQWLWAIEADHPAAPYVMVWPRGFAKSTSVEVGCAALAARGTRNYCLYVSSTQNQADGHVASVAAMLESEQFEKNYPRVARRKLSKYGHSRGWRRNRLRTASGFTIDAMGLDTGARGIKVETNRPDYILFDDVDELFDGPAAVAKKIETITQTILPARAKHAAVLIAQNLIHEDGVVARLADGRADFLADRIVSGPHPAIANLVVEEVNGKQTIVSGVPTWDAVTIPELQKELDDIGLTAFVREKQHEVGNIEGGIFGHVHFRHCTWDELPAMERIVVAVDPAVTDKDGSDAHGIQADGLGVDDDVYRLYSWESRTSPKDSMRRAILKAVELGADTVVVETDQGGDTWEIVYNDVWDELVADPDVPQITADTFKPAYKENKAGSVGSKAMRANLMLADYDRAQFVHVIGTHLTLEKALKRYLKRKPYDLVDAGFWSWRELRNPDEEPGLPVYTARGKDGRSVRT